MSEFGFVETNLDPTPSTSSWSLRYSLQSPTGEWLDICKNELTKNPKRARLITAEMARNIRRDWAPARALALRKGLGRG